MSDVQRWNRYSDALDMFKHADGDWVTYADHVEALRQAVEGRPDPGINEREAYARADGYEQGQRDALAAATERVEVWAARRAYGLQAWDGLFRAIKGEPDV
jgi:hypothetical protein